MWDVVLAMVLVLLVPCMEQEAVQPSMCCRCWMWDVALDVMLGGWIWDVVLAVVPVPDVGRGVE